MALRNINGYTKVVLNIGDWDMDTTATLTVAHGLSATEWKTIRDVSVIIRNDADTFYYNLDQVSAVFPNPSASWKSLNDTNLYLERIASGAFDTPTFSSTSYNRGWITLEYISD